MGQRMPPVEIEYGDDCLAAFDAGKTPKFIYVRLSGMSKCPAGDHQPPNGRVFKIRQSAVNPCSWFDVFEVWEVSFNIWVGPLRTNINLHNDDDGLDYFEDTQVNPADEGHVHHNDIVACNGVFGGKDGIAIATWSPQATTLLESINMAKSVNLFMELFPLEDGKLVYKFCRLQDATNVKILFEP